MAAQGMDERGMELKVGAMILIALSLLVVFLLILGDWSLKSRNEMEIYFQNPGGLSAGAAVKVAGRRAGTITEMSYLGQEGPQNPLTLMPSLVRCRISLDEDVFDSLRADARFYVTTKGVLGDPYLEIEPGASPMELKPGDPVFGVDPPRLDLMVSDAYRLVRGLSAILERNSSNIDRILGGSARLLGAFEQMVDGGAELDRIDNLVQGIEGLVGETRELVTGAKEKFVDDPKVSKTIANMESITVKLDRELDPLIKEVKDALSVVDRLGETIGPKQQAQIKSALTKLNDIAERTDKTLSAVSRIVDKIEAGEGTVGAMLEDEEIYDDLKELLRDIKRHPWKIIWKE